MSDTPPDKLEIERRPGISDSRLMAEAVVNPIPRNAQLVGALGKGAMGDPSVSLAESVALVGEAAKKVEAKDLSGLTAMLTAQAMTLDAVFTEMTRRAANNLGSYPDAVDRYTHLALKAQSQCRTTVEALTKIVRGNEQVVKHVYVDNRGGQAVIAETVHTGGGTARNAGQPHAEAMLRSADPLGGLLPDASDAERSLPDAWGALAGGAEGQPQCVEAWRPIGGDNGSVAVPDRHGAVHQQAG